MSVQKPGSPMPPRPPEPPPPPPPAEKKGSIVGKFVKFVLFVAIVAGIVTMYIHGKRMGEERAIKGAVGTTTTPEVARQNASFLPPWNWTTDEWDSYKAWTFKMGAAAKEKGTQIYASGRDKISAQIAEMRKKSPTTPQTTSTQPGTTPGSTTPGGPSSTSPQPAGMAQNPDAQRAHRLVMEASELWEKHDFPAAKAKLEEAKPILDKLPSGDPAVEEDRRLAHDLMEDIAAR